MALNTDVEGEQVYRIAIGQGMYTSELSSAIPDGYSAICYNMVATGDSLENRIGIKQSSVTHRMLEVAPKILSSGVSLNDLYFFNTISPWNGDAAKPALVWGSSGNTVPGDVANSHTINMIRAAGTGSSDGFLSSVIPAQLIGACQYNGILYYSVVGDGIKKVTNINWTTDAVTTTAIASSATGTLRGLFTFKDRMWAWNGQYLYYTDLATVGGQPETWALAANRVPVVGPTGEAVILNVTPLGNRLAIFTTNGLFTLLVEGSPQSWIFRILDSQSISTTSQTAFESKGIIYYVNTQGVWATDCLGSTKLSGVIEDQWFLAKGKRFHTINPYEDGMIVSVAKAATNEIYLDKENCKTFYSKLDPIGWTLWNINDYELGESNYRIGMIWSASPKIPTFLNAEPTVYVMAAITDSTSASPTKFVMQLLVLDGGSDTYINRANATETLPVGIFLKTKHFDGENPYKLKLAKYGIIEMFTSDAEHIIEISWDNDFTTSHVNEIYVDTAFQDFTIGVGSNLLLIPGQFGYRRAALNIRASLQSDTSQIKIKDVALVQHTDRPSYEQVG